MTVCGLMGRFGFLKGTAIPVLHHDSWFDGSSQPPLRTLGGCLSPRVKSILYCHGNMLDGAQGQLYLTTSLIYLTHRLNKASIRGYGPEISL